MSARVTSSEVAIALIDDHDPNSGWMTFGGKIIEPRSEIWLAGAQMWVRADGMRVSGWRGNDYFAERFGWLARLRIRQAARWWARRQLHGASPAIGSSHRLADPNPTPPLPHVDEMKEDSGSSSSPDDPPSELAP